MKHSQAFIITILLGTCLCMISVSLWDLNLNPSIQNINLKLEKTSRGWKELASRKQHQAKGGGGEWGGNAKTQREKISHTHKPMQLAAHVLYYKIKKIMNNKTLPIQPMWWSIFEFLFFFPLRCKEIHWVFLKIFKELILVGVFSSLHDLTFLDLFQRTKTCI
jgi:hypothetical protein